MDGRSRRAGDLNTLSPDYQRLWWMLYSVVESKAIWQLSWPRKRRDIDKWIIKQFKEYSCATVWVVSRSFERSHPPTEISCSALLPKCAQTLPAASVTRALQHPQLSGVAVVVVAGLSSSLSAPASVHPETDVPPASQRWRPVLGRATPPARSWVIGTG